MIVYGMKHDSLWDEIVYGMKHDSLWDEGKNAVRTQ